MATTPHVPPLPDDTDNVASDDAFADDTTRRAADARADQPVDPSGDAAPLLDDAAGTDDEDVAAEAPGRGTRRGR